MATSPHQPKQLADRITELKEELASKIALRTQLETLGQSTAAGGTSTTYPSYAQVCARIDWLNAQIESLVAQLVGDDNPAPGVNHLRYRSEYA